MPKTAQYALWAIAVVLALMLLWFVAKAVFPFALGAAAGFAAMWWYQNRA
jgi:hypothetical protein